MDNAILATLAPRKKINYNKIYSALILNLALLLPQNIPMSLFEGKMETFLTCRKISSYFKEKFLDDKTGNFFEEVALNAVYKTLQTGVQISDLKLLFSELPNILPLDYPVTKDIRNACINIMQQFLFEMRRNVPKHDPALWDRYFHLEEQLNFLKAFNN